MLGNIVELTNPKAVRFKKTYVGTIFGISQLDFPGIILEYVSNLWNRVNMWYCLISKYDDCNMVVKIEKDI